MSKFSSLQVPEVDMLQIAVVPPKTIRLNGTITMQEPSRILGGFFRAVHDAAIADNVGVLELDLTKLKFVNSSAIRVFLDWAGWLKQASDPCYKLKILTTRKFTWQKTSFVALTALAADHIVLSNQD